MSGGGGSARIHIESVHNDDVRRALKKLKPKYSAGPDGIPPYVVKDCNSVFISPLQYIFNLCYRNSYYPDVWKTSRVVPVPKKGSSSEVSNFRPIAILSVFGKLFESILEHYIRTQFEYQLSEAQHGFRAGRSTCTNLLTFWTYVTGAVDTGLQVDAAYFDFQKAFDAVDNDVLLSKFASVGFTPLLLKFFSSYLGNRKQYVQYEGYYSHSYCTYSGVSQGSNLGPLEFLILINDLPSVISRANCLLFADDLKIYLSVENSFDAQLLQSDIDNVLQWCERNKLFFNIKKCAVITFSRQVSPLIVNYDLAGSNMSRVSTIRDLGVIMSDDLTFRVHVNDICAKAYRILGFVLRQAQQLKSFASIKLLYNAFVRSKLECNAIVWNPHEHKYIDMVEKIQKKFIRWVYRKQYGYSVGYPTIYPSMFLLGMTGYDTLEIRRKVALLSYILSLIQGEKSNPYILKNINLHVPNGYVLARRRTLFALPQCRTKLAKQAPLPRALRLLNDLVGSNLTLDVFHTKLIKLTKEIKLLLQS